tara:strand:- start:27 stop:419 length:393 start_codon:yes stop_codon:yes gene_type:complete
MPYKKVKSVLRQHNLRPTNQRVAIFNILFKEENWHFSADIVEKICSEKGIKISSGTIYNVLNDFYDKGLISKVMIDDDRSWFDTNISDHYHIYNTKELKLYDIEPNQIDLSLPKTIKKCDVKKVEILIKI